MYFLIAVLASMEDIQSVPVLEGKSALFTCKFSKGSVSNINIDWTFDGDQFDECGSTQDDIAPDGNGCYTNDTHSVLVLSSLATGSHPLQCILQQNIPEDFKNDPSFQENFNNIITRSASLTIMGRFLSMYMYLKRTSSIRYLVPLYLQWYISRTLLVVYTPTFESGHLTNQDTYSLWCHG